jgi:class 3 adenylate cyclase
MQLLNGYFDTVVLAIAGKGDEVLRFMGDAVRAFFPAWRRLLPTGQRRKSRKKPRQRKSPQGNRAWGVALHRREVSYVISPLSAVSIHADWPRPQHGDGMNCLCRHLS